MRTLREFLPLFLDSARLANWSPATIQTWDRNLSRFIDWCDQRELHDPSLITRPMLQKYQQFLHNYHTPSTQMPLRAGTQRLMLAAVKSFFRWLARNDFLPHNPAADLESPKRSKELPHNVLTREEVEAVLQGPDIQTPLGLRDRVLLEVLYSCGLRRLELIRLQVNAIDFTRGTLMVIQGKGRKDRMVPIGARALAWVSKYLTHARPLLAACPDNGILFITNRGKSFVSGNMSTLVNGYIRAASLGKSGSCHVFRHTMATLMLEGGADVRYIQEMLGHASLSSTQIYTRVAIGKLKEVHERTHPGKPNGMI